MTTTTATDKKREYEAKIAALVSMLKLDECEALPVESDGLDVDGNPTTDADGSISVVVDVTAAIAGRHGVADDEIRTAVDRFALAHVEAAADYSSKPDVEIDYAVEPQWSFADGRVLLGVMVDVSASSTRQRDPSPVAMLARSF